MRRLKNKRGITYVEVMIAILMVGVAASMYLQVFPGALKTRKTADNSKVAINAAQQKLEEIRDEARSVGGFYKITNRCFTVSGLNNSVGSVYVQDYMSGTTEIKKVTITITWNGACNTGSTVRLQTLISAFG